MDMLLAAVWFLLRVGLVGWATLAIWFMPLSGAWLRLALAALFFAFAAWALWSRRSAATLVAFAVVYVVILAFWSTIAPSHDREWRPDVAVMPRVVIDGDRVRVTGVRNFNYRGRDDFDVRYEEREVLLSRMTGVDFYISYWAEGPVGHTFLSFLFEDAPPLGVSIETRPESHEGFDPLASLFKQFELIYVVADERDLVGLRASHRDEEVFLYHTRISPEFARRLIRVYATRINELADRPEFYHLLSNSCTVNIIRYANKVGREGRFSIKHLLNGLIDQYVYAAGVVDTSLPFEELRRRSRITAAAQAAEGHVDFSRDGGHPARRAGGHGRAARGADSRRRKAVPHRQRIGHAHRLLRDADGKGGPGRPAWPREPMCGEAAGLGDGRDRVRGGQPRGRDLPGPGRERRRIRDLALSMHDATAA